MGKYQFKPEGVCSQLIHFSIEEGKLHDVQFFGCCNGNLKAIGRLVEGKDAESIAATLEGNTCGNRPTSCADQFSKAIKAALRRESEKDSSQTDPK